MPAPAVVFYMCAVRSCAARDTEMNGLAAARERRRTRDGRMEGIGLTRGSRKALAPQGELWFRSIRWCTTYAIRAAVGRVILEAYTGGEAEARVLLVAVACVIE